MRRYIWQATAMLGAVLIASRSGKAINQLNLGGEFSLPDRLHNLVDSQDDYFDAVQRQADADAAVMRAREAATKREQANPEYQAAVKAVDQAYQAYIDKKNAMVAQMEKSDPVYNKMKGQVTSIDVQIDSARQNPATTQEQLEELYKNRDTFQSQWNQLETDAMNRAGITPLKQAWEDATKKLNELRDKQAADVENDERLKGALAEAVAAHSTVEETRTAIGAPADRSQQDKAGDMCCRASRVSFAGNDAWWTYGWTNVSKPANPAGK